MYSLFIKRLIDIIFSFLIISFLSPLLIVVTIWLYFANKGAGAFFTPIRPGKDGKLFKVLKYKSMTEERDEEGKLLPDIKRLTTIGKFVRSTSIDELPQLFNVLKGDMSFIGPRPLAATYLPYYSNEERHRHDIRPGITGWAQINGRTSITWNQKMAYDLEYVDRVSFFLDVKILYMTIYKVLKRENIGLETSDTSTFIDFRESQWRKEGRFDLIEKARKQAEPYYKIIAQSH